MSESHRDDFTECWRVNVDRVHGYAVRHVGFDAAQEVVSETFMHAWRRWGTVPDPALPWLLGTARKVIGNRRRAQQRQTALHERIGLLDAVAADTPSAESSATHRKAALTALAALSLQEREALLLIAWEGLTSEEAASVMGLRVGTFRVRLHRARTRLSHALEANDDLQESPCLID